MTERYPERRSEPRSESPGHESGRFETEAPTPEDGAGDTSRSLGSTGTESPRAAEVMVGVPAYNEAGTIGAVVSGAVPYADEVVVVDDGSDDDTADRARDAGADVTVHEHNQGYGATLQTIFHRAHAADVDHLVILDGDGQHDPGDIPKLVHSQQQTEAEIVIASRFVGETSEDIPAYRRFGLAVVNGLTNAGLKLRYSSPRVSDTQSGFRAYDREAIGTIVEVDDIGYGMDASLDLLFHAAREGHEIAEVPTTVEYDVENGSTRNPILHGLSLVKAIGLEVLPGRFTEATSVAVAALAVLVIVGTIQLLEWTIVRAVVLFGVVIVAVTALLLSSTSRSSPGSTDR